jgi:energy-coupling factor transporter ATP-binding protein EcfA2
MERPELPDVDRILEMKLKDLMKLCKDLNVDCRGFRTATQFQEAVFDYMKQYATLHQAPPPFVTTAADLFRTFARKRLEVLTIVDSVKDFVSSEDVKPWLEKLHVDQFDCWMTPKMFEETKEAVTRGTPTLLVAGPTSAGKSTLLNALLGEQVLPTSYNATTSALCEIKYSQTPGKKYAVVHLNTGESEYSTIELDLTAEEGRIQFAEYVYANREQLAQESNIDGDEAIPVCTRAEIYWPEEFLKHFTLVDSPGVTEQEGDSVARQLTERFQTDLACGFIYVVDGTRSAEEAAQVGGLLLAVSKGTGSLPSSNSALFVINKWDLASQQMRKDERQEFLSKLEMQVSSRWTGLKPQQQLITMNAKLAVRAQQLGSSTADMKRLCKSIEQLLPKGMDHMLLQGLRSIQSLLDRIEQSTESTLRLLELPMEERMKKYESDWNKLESFRREDGTYGKQIHELQGMVNRQIRKLVRDLWSDLKLGKGKDTILMFKNDHMRDWERTVYDAREVQTLVEGRVTSAILQHEGFEEFIQWAASEIKKPVEYLLAQLQVFGAEVTSFNPSTVDTSWADCLTDDKKGWKPTQVAKAVAVGAMAVAAAPVALVLGLIAIPVYKAVQAVGNMTFKKTYTKAYGEFLDRACQDDYKELQTIITDLLGRSCEPVKMLHFDIPRCIGELKRELETRAKQEEEFKGDYKSMLELCRARKKKIAEFVLNLNIHDYAEDEIQWPNPLRPEATGSFGKVFKVTVPEKGTSAIKLMTEAVNEENAEEYLKELNVCR